jgi:hypothetical protein
MSNTTRIISNLSKLENQFHTFHGEHNDQIQRLIDDCLRAVYQPSYGEPTKEISGKGSTQAFKIFLLLLKIKEQVFGKHSLPGGVIDSLSN